MRGVHSKTTYRNKIYLVNYSVITVKHLLCPRVKVVPSGKRPENIINYY